jgi:hypothetical protein
MSGYQDYSQTVTVTDDQTSAVSYNLVTVTAAPAITGISPTSGYNSSSISNVVITGSGFSTSGASVVLYTSGQTNITGTIVSATATQLTCTFPITGKTAGSWNVIVTNSDGQSATLSGGFAIVNPSSTVTLTSITPSSALANSTVSITSLSGTNFQSSATMRLRRSGYNDIYGTVSTLSSTTITGTFNLTNEAPGPYQVCVINPNTDALCGLTFTIGSDKVTNGSIYFQSSPSGASVYLNNTLVGTTTFTLYNVTPGGYQVLMEESGYHPYTGTVTVTSGSQASVYGTLVALPSVTTATPVAAAPTTYTLVPTVKHTTIPVPTAWPSDTPTPASPVGPLAIIGAVGIAILVMRK